MSTQTAEPLPSPSPPLRSFFKRYAWFIDGCWLVLLALYALAGVPLNAFNTDETAHIINSRDYADVFLHGELMSLPVGEPLESWRSFTRLLDSTVSRYAFGLAWHLAGASEAELPTRPYVLTIPHEESHAAGRLPSDRVLNASRTVSTVFFAVSTLVLFLIVRAFGPRPLAYGVTALYGLNPVLLINVRRAMQEGALLCFGLLVILVVIRIVQRHNEDRAVSWRWWLTFTLVSALAILSKNSALLYVVAGFGWIFVVYTMHGWPELPIRITVILGLCGILIMALYLLFSPGLWSDPIQRLKDVVELRASEMDRITYNLEGPTPLAWRVESIFEQTYLREAEFADSKAFRGVRLVAQQAVIYAASPLAGLTLGPMLGWFTTLFAIAGLAVICVPGLRPSASEALYFGIPIWLLPVVVSLLLNPLSIQRYFLPIIPIVMLLTGFGVYGIVRLGRLGMQAFSLRGERPRVVTGVVIAVFLSVAFVYSDQLDLGPYYEPPPVFGNALSTTFRAIMARIDRDPRYEARLFLTSSAPGESVTLSQSDTQIVSAETDFFCLQSANSQHVCFSYDAVRRLVAS